MPRRQTPRTLWIDGAREYKWLRTDSDGICLILWKKTFSFFVHNTISDIVAKIKHKAPDCLNWNRFLVSDFKKSSSTKGVVGRCLPRTASLLAAAVRLCYFYFLFIYFYCTSLPLTGTGWVQSTLKLCTVHCISSP